MDKPELTFEQLVKLHFTAGMYGLDAQGLDKFMAKRKDEGWFDPNKLSVKQLFSLDARRWDNDIVALPIWMRNFFGDGVELVTTKGEPVVVGRDEISVEFPDKNSRPNANSGLLKYGVLKEAPAEESQEGNEGQEGGFTFDSNDPRAKAIMDKLSQITGQKIDGIKFK
jgi:hypothetical protein